MDVHLEGKFSPEELKELRQDLESLKEPDPKNLNKVSFPIIFYLGWYN